jgi:hypothetical protein
MIVLSSLIAAPALWLINAGGVATTHEVHSDASMYHLASVNSAEAESINVNRLMTAEHWTDPRNGSDFPVSGRYQFARKRASEIVSDQNDPH